MSAEIRPSRPRSSDSAAPFGTLSPWLRATPAAEAEGVREALRILLEDEVATITQSTLDRRISAIDRALSAQLDLLLHDPALQRLEARWRGLAFVVEHIPTAGDVRLELLSVSPEELALDFADAPEITDSGLYERVYTRALATYGAPPYGLLCGDFATGPASHDLDLLRAISRVCAAAQVPFVGNAEAELLGVKDFAELPGLADLGASIRGAAGRRWESLRRDPNARYLGLCLPRFLLRSPVDVDRETRSPLRYRERIRGDADLLWGHASLTFAVRAAQAFARYRWCVSILGSTLCPVIPACPPDLDASCSVDLLLSRRLEGELAAAGFVAVTYDRRLRGLTLHSAPSIAEHPAHTPHAELSTQLPYVFLSGRVAHYLRRIERDTIGAWDDPKRLEVALRTWLRRHVADLEDAHWETRARRPLRRADLHLSRTPGGWIRVRLELEPHFTHHGAPIVLTTHSRLDPASPADHLAHVDDIS